MSDTESRAVDGESPAVDGSPSGPAEAVEQVAVTANGNKKSKGIKGLSRDMQFPALPLSVGVQVAEIIYAEGGTCDLVQLAHGLGQEPRSGAFVPKPAATRAFGLIVYRAGKLALTPLGYRIIQQDQAVQAKIDALLSVPLFRKMYDNYKGRELPPHSGIEGFLRSQEMPPKEAARARDVFLKSAKTAGLFERDEKRMILPRGATDAATSTDVVEEEPEGPPPPPPDQKPDGTGMKGNSNPGTRKLHPMIQSLIEEIPSPDAGWSQEALDKWMTMFNMAVTYVYGVKPTIAEAKLLGNASSNELRPLAEQSQTYVDPITGARVLRHP